MALAVSACSSTDWPGLGSARLATSVTVSTAAIDVAAPDGYCLDSNASDLGGAGAFVVFRSCADLGGSGGLRAVLTAAISPVANPQPVVAGAETALAAYFKSVDGRRALSREGTETTVKVTSAWQRPGVVFVAVEDRSAAVSDGLTDAYLRAVLDVKGRLVTLTVTGYTAAPLAEAASRRLMQAFVDRMLAANASQPAQGDSTSFLATLAQGINEADPRE